MAEECRLSIKVVPRAARDEIAGWLGDALKVKVAAVPEKGRANAAVERLLGDALGVGEAAVTVVAGGSSPRKIVRIDGLAEDEVRRRLGR